MKAVVTGANRGLGLEFVRQLLARGDEVVATCRTPRAAAGLIELESRYRERLAVLALDVSDARSCHEFVKSFQSLGSRLDLLIHNAGTLPAGETFGSMTAEAFTNTFRTNVQGPVLLTQALADDLATRATVITISSDLASMTDAAGFVMPSYSISKAALNMATRLLGHALAAREITVRAMSPGWVSTDMGGSDAPLEPAESVSVMLATIDALRFDRASIGTFVSNTGVSKAW